MSYQDDDFDLELISSDDDLLDALGSGMPSEGAGRPAGGLDELLSDWRSELAGAGPDLSRSVTLAEEIPDEFGLLRGRRSRRRALAIGALGVSAVLAMTGTAAAITGAHGPLGGLHRALFGGAASQRAPDLMALRVQTLLDHVAVRVAAGRSAGGISVEQRSGAAAILAEADALLRGDSTAPGMLVRRAASLRAALDDLPMLRLPPTADRRTAPSAASTSGPSARVATPLSSTASRGASSGPFVGPAPVAKKRTDGTGTDQAGDGGDLSHPLTGSDLQRPVVQPSSAAGSGDGTSHGDQQPSPDGSQSSGDTGRGAGKASQSGSGDPAVEGG